MGAVSSNALSSGRDGLVLAGQYTTEKSVASAAAATRTATEYVMGAGGVAGDLGGHVLKLAADGLEAMVPFASLAAPVLKSVSVALNLVIDLQKQRGFVDTDLKSRLELAKCMLEDAGSKYTLAASYRGTLDDLQRAVDETIDLVRKVHGRGDFWRAFEASRDLDKLKAAAKAIYESCLLLGAAASVTSAKTDSRREMLDFSQINSAQQGASALTTNWLQKFLHNEHRGYDRLPSIFHAGEFLAANVPKVGMQLRKRGSNASCTVRWDALMRGKHVISGAAGSGKSTLLRSMCYEAPKERFCVLLPMRNVARAAPVAFSEGRTVEQAAGFLVARAYGLNPSPDQLRGIADALFDAGGERTVWLLDGFDELPGAESLKACIDAGDAGDDSEGGQDAVRRLLRFLLSQPNRILSTRPQFADSLKARVELQKMDPDAVLTYLNAGAQFLPPAVADAPYTTEDVSTAATVRSNFIDRVKRLPSLLDALCTPVVLQLAIGVESHLVPVQDEAPAADVGEVTRIYERVVIALRHQLIRGNGWDEDEATAEFGQWTALERVLGPLALSGSASNEERLQWPRDMMALLPALQAGRLVDVLETFEIEFKHRSLKEFFAARWILSTLSTTTPWTTEFDGQVRRALNVEGNDQLRRFVLALAKDAPTAAKFASMIWDPLNSLGMEALTAAHYARCAPLAAALEDCPFVVHITRMEPFKAVADMVAKEAARRWGLVSRDTCDELECDHHGKRKPHLLRDDEGPFWKLANVLEKGRYEELAVAVLEDFARSIFPATRRARCAVVILRFVSARSPRALDSLKRLRDSRMTSILSSGQNTVRLVAIIAHGVLGSSTGDEIKALIELAGTRGDDVVAGQAVAELLSRHGDVSGVREAVWRIAADPGAPATVVYALISSDYWLPCTPPESSVVNGNVDGLLRRVAVDADGSLQGMAEDTGAIILARMLSKLELALRTNDGVPEALLDLTKKTSGWCYKNATFVEGAVASIVGAMTAYNSVVDVAEQGCEALSRIVIMLPFYSQQAAVNAGALSAVVKAISSHMDIVSVTETGFRALERLLTLPDARAVFAAARAVVAADALAIIANAMAVHILSPSIAEYGCKVLSSCFDKFITFTADEMQATDAMSAIALAMMAHTNNATIARFGCYALRAILSNVFTGHLRLETAVAELASTAVTAILATDTLITSEGIDVHPIGRQVLRMLRLRTVVSMRSNGAIIDATRSRQQ